MRWNKAYVIGVALLLGLFCLDPGFVPGLDPTPSLVWAEGDPGAGGQGAPCPQCPECPDPAKVVLRGLEEKRRTLDQTQVTLDQQRKELERYAEQVDEKILALDRLKKQINEDLARLEKKKSQKQREEEAAYEAKINRLVKMYAGMKPKNAAQIVDQMDLKVAEEIFLRMRESSAAQILAFVNSEKAAKISERLAFRRK